MIDEAVLARIQRAIESVRFGSVQIMIHDAHVVQIATTEKTRVLDTAHLTSGGPPKNPLPADRTTGSCQSPHETAEA